MKKKRIINTLFIVLAIYLFPQISYSQEIIDIPPTWNGSEFGVINRFIMSDTTAGGERAHPNAIYRLKRGEYYDVDHALSIDFNFTLIGEDGPADVRPAMISRGVDAQGGYISMLFNFRGDSLNIAFKNIIFNGVQDDNQIVNRGATLFVITGAYHKVKFDKCVFSGWGGNIINGGDANRMTYIWTNNIFRNGVDKDNPWGGNIYTQVTTTAHNDTIKFINNTFFNYSSYQFLSWEFVDYIEYSHNTMFKSTLNAHWAPYLTNAKFNNNIFYDYQVVGETTYETENGFWDKGGANGNHRSSICKLDLVDPQTLLDYGMTEANRKVEYKNNVYFWSQAVKDYWATHKDSSTGVELDIMPITFMNDYTKTMFDDDSAYPNLIAENNDEMDPGFDADLISAVLEKEFTFVKLYRRYGFGGMSNPQERYYAPDNNFWDIPWPLPESLRYTNDSVKTHSTDGLPAGDLNWWPELVGVEKDKSLKTIPNDYTLSQNYPNPFNPSTVIKFNIPKAGQVDLGVYNVLGQKVATIVNKELQAGSYKYQFDANNLTSGIYFYKLQSNNYTEVKKMMLVK